MGSTSSRLFGLLFVSRPVRILMVGLDAAGKTTILYKLKLGEVVHTTPTIGFNVETVAYKNLKFTMWDIGGQDRLRPLWRHYYEGCEGVIFVVDSNDQDRLGLARAELQKMMHEDLLSKASLLVLANKQDLPNAVPCNEVAESWACRTLAPASGSSKAPALPPGQGCTKEWTGWPAV
eukprot:TRINITY_DN1156_c0_g1_i1.p1 TRINITY_DN1156_c0_g1~~TRINITY_DN1156_c0_g1_i1.p1  ORF type:complete len:187 (-),score=26.80 TRINITY_DN1156_c0_g1_i1:297-827(-)